MITEYSVGFLHTEDTVVLIRKNRPQWQAGLLNGVGGHIEEGEDPHSCQVREFREETGVSIGPWEHFLTLEGTSARVFCFAIYDEEGQWVDKVDTVTDEDIEVWHVDDLNGLMGHSITVPNLEWIVPLMLQRDKYRKPITIEFHGDA